MENIPRIAATKSTLWRMVPAMIFFAIFIYNCEIEHQKVVSNGLERKNQ